MAAIVVFLFLSGRSIATSMVVVRPETIGPAPLGAGTQVEGGRRRLFWFAMQTIKASSYDASGAFADEASSDLADAGVPGVAGRRPLRDGMQYLAKRITELTGSDLPARRSGRKAQPHHGAAVATVTGPARLPPQPDGAFREVSAAALALWD
ncbi:hypothetical protein M1D34_27545 (plasmid) [Ensifer sp. D2-11]